MFKSIISVIVAFGVLLSLNSKGVYKNDISNRLIVQGIGIDVLPDDTYSLTVQAINTSTHTASTGESSDEVVKIYKVTGRTVYTALKSIVEYEGKIPMYSQNRIVVIGNSAAKKGLEGIIDFFCRDADSGPSVLVAVADKTAEEILSVKVKGEVVAKNIDFAIRSADFEGEIYRLELYELINRYKNETCSFAMPVLSNVTSSKGANTIEVSGTGLFRDGRLTKIISRDETEMYNFLNNSFYNGELAFSLPHTEKISLNIADCKTKINARIVDGKPCFKIKLKVTADITEIYNGVSVPLNRNKLDEIERESEQQLKYEIDNLIKKLYYENCTDALGLSRLLHLQCRDFYRAQKNNLNSTMSQSTFPVEIDIRIRRVGHDYVRSY